jgi:hypothetical protein
MMGLSVIIILPDTIAPVLCECQGESHQSGPAVWMLKILSAEESDGDQDRGREVCNHIEGHIGDEFISVFGVS